MYALYTVCCLISGIENDVSSLSLTKCLSCVAANADVSAAGSIVVAADEIDTFSNEVLCGTHGDAVTVATVDLSLIKSNLDLSTITAESRDTVGTCISGRVTELFHFHVIYSINPAKQTINKRV